MVNVVRHVRSERDIETLSLRPPPSVFRLSWPALLAGAIAMAALWAREQWVLSLLPLLVVALIATGFTDRRLSDAGQTWLVRVLLFGAVTAIGLVRPFPDTSGLYDPRVLCLMGELFAAELTLQGWRLRPAGGGHGIVTILLSGLILLPAADSTEDRAIWFLAPAYVCCLALALPSFRPQEQGISAPSRVSVASWLALGLALGFGAGGHVLFRAYRDDLTQWGMQMLHEARAPEPGGTLSTNPSLGPSYGLEGSPERAYRIEESVSRHASSASFDHLRVMAFDTYTHGRWLPREEQRRLRSFPAHVGKPIASGAGVRITRLLSNGGLLIAPLATVGLDLSEQTIARGALEMGPLKSEASVPSAYRLTAGTEDSKEAEAGLFAAPPTLEQRRLLLNVPPEIDARVYDLARQAVGGVRTPAAMTSAIAAYLPGAHGYSLNYRPGSGDPVSRFLLSRAPAHCEYFAAAAVLLLRCVGVPSRYVIGYYAHERDITRALLIRQRDAHAWTEAWIDGRGWITVDATPASGRPDRTGAAPWLTRVSESIQDSLSVLRARLGSMGLPLLFLGIAVAAGVILWRNRPRRGTKSILPAPDYASPGAELASLAARFELACRRRGLICPPNRTWQEVLAVPPVSADPRHPFDLEAARAFVTAYNATRWGGIGVTRMQTLTGLLQRIEK